MKIIITGGTGFIGKNLSQKLIQKGHEITILTRKTYINQLKANYKKVDYFNLSSLMSAISEADLIIHLAATLFSRTKKEFFKTNTLITQNLIKAANSAGVKKIIYISSLAAGGPSKNSVPRNEDMEDNPISYYGKSKLQSEKELNNFKHDYLILRPPIVYGPKDSGFSEIAKWVKKGIMVVPGDKNVFFSFIFLEDLTNCIVQAIENNLFIKEKFYICENKTYRWEEFIEKMAEKMKVKKPIMINLPAPLLYTAGLIYEILSFIGGFTPTFNRDKVREAIAGNWICSPEKWEKTTQTKNWTTLEEGLSLTFDKERDNKTLSMDN